MLGTSPSNKCSLKLSIETKPVYMPYRQTRTQSLFGDTQRIVSSSSPYPFARPSISFPNSSASSLFNRPKATGYEPALPSLPGVTRKSERKKRSNYLISTGIGLPLLDCGKNLVWLSRMRKAQTHINFGALIFSSLPLSFKVQKTLSQQY